MSFILEALNKAERDRGAHAGHAIPLPQPIENNSKRQWLLVFMISIAGSALVLGVFLVLQNAGTFMAEPPAAAVTSHGAEVPIRSTTNTASVVSAPRIEKTPKPVIPKTSVRPDMATKNGNNSAARLHSMVSRPNQTRSEPVTDRNQLVAADTFTEAETEVEIAAAKPAPSSVVYLPEVKKPISPERYSNIPIMHNLPESTRTQLPALELNVHVFSNNPAKRFVYINSVRYSEGAQVSDEITLEEIISTGVILNYGGTYFRIIIET